jgi:hypothetical protein
MALTLMVRSCVSSSGCWSRDVFHAHGAVEARHAVEEPRDLMVCPGELELDGDAGVELARLLRLGLHVPKADAAQLGGPVDLLEEGGHLGLLRQHTPAADVDGLARGQLLLNLHELLLTLQRLVALGRLRGVGPLRAALMSSVMG